MDKELLRIAIIATGLIVMVAMLISAYLKDKKAREDEIDYYDEYDDDEFEEDEDFTEEDDEPVSTTKSAVTPSRSRGTSDFHENTDSKTHEHDDDIIPPRPSVAPSIIQFSVITKGHEDFNGADIFFELENLGMEYGSMKIFERIDENRFVHFGVACMLEPGTFPDKNLENFYCPGVVFFMQIDGLDDPQAVFDDYISTAVLFAERMNGVVLDHRRQLLTTEMVEAIRRAL